MAKIRERPANVTLTAEQQDMIRGLILKHADMADPAWQTTIRAVSQLVNVPEPLDWKPIEHTIYSHIHYERDTCRFSAVYRRSNKVLHFDNVDRETGDMLMNYAAIDGPCRHGFGLKNIAPHLFTERMLRLAATHSA